MERKLTAILCADAYGYSRLMGEDEEATLHTLSSYRKIIAGLIRRHHGRFVNSAGDNVLASVTMYDWQTRSMVQPNSNVAARSSADKLKP